MGIFDGLLGQVLGGGETDTVIANLAEKVGLTPEQAQTAVSALAQAHAAPGDTVQAAADSTGLPQDTLQEIMGHLGGEGSLASIASNLFGGGTTAA